MSGTAHGTVTITIDGTGQSITLPMMAGSLGPDVFDIRKLYAEAGVFTYDPGYGGTAACDSKITYIDGDEGILLHRGYPIAQLAEHSTFVEVAHLLLNGEQVARIALGRSGKHDCHGTPILTFGGVKALRAPRLAGVCKQELYLTKRLSRNAVGTTVYGVGSRGKS